MSVLLRRKDKVGSTCSRETKKKIGSNSESSIDPSAIAVDQTTSLFSDKENIDSSIHREVSSTSSLVSPMEVLSKDSSSLPPLVPVRVPVPVPVMDEYEQDLDYVSTSSSSDDEDECMEQLLRCAHGQGEDVVSQQSADSMSGSFAQSLGQTNLQYSSNHKSRSSPNSDRSSSSPLPQSILLPYLSDDTMTPDLAPNSLNTTEESEKDLFTTPTRRRKSPTRRCQLQLRQSQQQDYQSPSNKHYQPPPPSTKISYTTIKATLENSRNLIQTAPPMPTLETTPTTEEEPSSPEPPTTTTSMDVVHNMGRLPVVIEEDDTRSNSSSSTNNTNKEQKQLLPQDDDEGDEDDNMTVEDDALYLVMQEPQQQQQSESENLNPYYYQESNMEEKHMEHNSIFSLEDEDDDDDDSIADLLSPHHPKDDKLTTSESSVTLDSYPTQSLSSEFSHYSLKTASHNEDDDDDDVDDEGIDPQLLLLEQELNSRLEAILALKDVILRQKQTISKTSKENKKLQSKMEKMLRQSRIDKKERNGLETKMSEMGKETERWKRLYKKERQNAKAAATSSVSMNDLNGDKFGKVRASERRRRRRARKGASSSSSRKKVDELVETNVIVRTFNISPKSTGDAMYAATSPKYEVDYPGAVGEDDKHETASF